MTGGPRSVDRSARHPGATAGGDTASLEPDDDGLLLEPEEDGFGLIGIAVSLVVIAALTAVAFTLGGTGATTTGGGQNAEVARAYDVAAQATLSTTLTNVRNAALADGGYGAVDLTQLGVSSGPATSAQGVSGVVSAAGAAPGTGGLTVPGVGGTGGTGGTVTLAARSQSGACFFVWASAGVTWYGAAAHPSSCVAVPMAGPPAPTAGSGVTWRTGGFPAA